MSLTGRQHGLYAQLWKGVAAVTGDGSEEARRALQARLGLPGSRRDWGNAEFDEWKRECLAIAQPANLAAQLDGLDGEGKRRRYVIRELLEAMDAPEAYAERTARTMGFAGTLETLRQAELEKVIVALRKQVVRTAKRGVLRQAQDLREEPF